MHALIFPVLVSIGLTLVLTPVIREIFGAYGVVDEPDQDRKTHKHPVARGGGIGIQCLGYAEFSSGNAAPHGPARKRSVAEVRIATGGIRPAEGRLGVVPPNNTHKLIAEAVRWDAASHRPGPEGVARSSRSKWMDAAGFRD